jgi:uncharacterized protein (DUF1800 family)
MPVRRWFLDIPTGGGVEDGERVLEILASDPRTADFVAGKLCRHFLGDSESPVKSRLAKAYIETGGDIQSMLRPLFISKELLEGPPVAKRPFDYVVSAMRAVNAESDCSEPLQRHLEQMGQSLYQWPMPDGYPDGAQPWTGSLLARWNFAMALTGGKIPGTETNVSDLADRTNQKDAVDAAAALVFTRELEPSLRTRFANHAGQDVPKAAALMLASPEFQWR